MNSPEKRGISTHGDDRVRQESTDPEEVAQSWHQRGVTVSTYTQVYYHIVFWTKDRAPVLAQSGRERLFRYAWGIVRNSRCHLYRINGTLDHLHLLTSLHPTVSLADFVKQIKAGTSRWMKTHNLFPGFSYWQAGYGAFTHSIQDKDRLIEYIKSQEDHHRAVSFADELRTLLLEAGLEVDERYLASGR